MRTPLLIATAAAALLAGTATAQTTAPATTPTPAGGMTATQPAGPAAAGAPAATAAPAAAASGPAAGATVYDAQGNEVGKIEAIEGQFATLATAKSKARLPLTSFGTSPKGPTLGMTAAEVDAAAGPQGAAAGAAPGAAPAGQAAAAATAAPVKLAKGATVSDSAGAKVGTIEEVSGEFAVVATGKNKVRLPLNAFADSGKGPVIGMTAAELDAAASAAKPKSGG